MTSPMSITQLVNNQIDIEDPDVKIAAEALGELSNKPVITLPPLSTPSTTPSSPLPTPTSTTFQERLSFSSESTIEEDNNNNNSKLQFIHRVSNLPILNSALKVYENSKNSNSVVKYGAEMVESIAAPIYSLSGVDEWGCKQLDKLESRYSVKKEPIEEQQEIGSDDDASYALSRILLDDGGLRKRNNNSRGTSPHRPHSITKPVPTRHHHHHHQYNRQPPLVRSKWHQIVMHASSAAGTTAAVISEESMKCLRYCLSWLQYASQHIDQQMNLLKNFLVSLASDNKKETTTVTTHASTLAQIKKEIVDTLRKVVDVISKYAGSGLPEQAKASVRGFILALPTRWAILNSSKSTSPVNSPQLNPTHDIQETSVKLLNFGGESVEMIQSVENVFSDTIERAELWLNRLKVVGVAGNRSTTTTTTTTTKSTTHAAEHMDTN